MKILCKNKIQNINLTINEIVNLNQFFRTLVNYGALYISKKKEKYNYPKNRG